MLAVPWGYPVASMQLEITDERPRPPALPLVFASVGFAGVGAFAWLIVALAWATKGPLGGRGYELWLLLFGTLAGTAAGSAATYVSRRWWPFIVGIAIALVPVVLAAILIGSAPATSAD